MRKIKTMKLIKTCILNSNRKKTFSIDIYFKILYLDVDMPITYTS